MTVDREALRERYLAAIEAEILVAKSRLGSARPGPEASRRAQSLAAIADVTIEWLEAERDRLRAGGTFDKDGARRLLGDLG